MSLQVTLQNCVSRFVLLFVIRNNLSAITKYFTKAISVIDKSKLFLAITMIGNKLSPINYLDKCPSLVIRLAGPTRYFVVCMSITTHSINR